MFLKSLLQIFFIKHLILKLLYLVINIINNFKDFKIKNINKLLINN
jgi:hypothetical protein